MVISESQRRADCTPSDIVALMDVTDWDRTPVGPRALWPESLSTALSIMVNSGFPMVVMWGNDLVLFYNASYAPVLGDKHPWAMGRPMREVWPEIWATIGPMLHGVLETGVATYDEDLLLPLFRSGYLEECYFTFSYSPIANRDAIGGVFCAVAETSRKVIGERRLRTLHDLEAQAFAAKDVDGACLTATEALRRNQQDVPFSRIYLYDKNERLRLIDFSGPPPASGEVWPVEEVARTNTARIVPSTIDAAAVLISPARVTSAIVLPIAAPGQERATGAMVVGISPFSELDGEYRRFVELVVGQIAAATNSARAYADAQTRAEALAELDRAKTTFFSNISHEFRTPLTLLLGPIENVLREGGDKLDAAMRGELFTARRNSYRLLKLVNHLLEFSRIEANRADASFELTDLAAFTTDVASGFRSSIEGAGLRLDVRGDMPVNAYVDRSMFERIILNLLSNALKFTFEGGITVSVWSDATTAFVRVSDTGSGIAKEELPFLFERFRRIRGAKSRADEGTGIGLALVDELVRMHGGRIDVESRLGVGTTFTIAVPLGKTHLPSEHIVASTAPPRASVVRITQYVEEAAGWLGEPEASVDEKLASGTILVVDDNADLRSYLRRILSKRWQIEVANDGIEALERIRSKLPDLVLSDTMMPNCDGIELLQRLRSNPETERLPIVLLSARAGEEASIDGLRHGADDYIVKPFSEEQLVARIDAVLKIAKVREEATTAALRRLDAAVESQQFLRMLADAIPQMVFTASPEGKVEYFNRRWYEYTGLTPDESRDGGWIGVVHPEDLPVALETWRHAVATGEDVSDEVRLRNQDGTYRWFLCQAVAIRSVDGSVLRWFSSATDVDEQKRLHEQQRLFAHISNVLASTLDVGQILEKITELCVPTFADWCQVQVRSADDRLVVEAVHHRDPEKAAVLKRLVGREVIKRDSAIGTPEVLRSVKMRVLDHAATLRAVRENVPDVADRVAYELAGLGTALIVPLAVGERALGTLHFVNIDPEAPPTSSKIAVAEELARRAALAIDNSQLYEREHRVATALQQAMLPTHLPEVARIDFSSAYRPAERESLVGGDWYDAFLIRPDVLAVSIGDVGGHGLGAAVAMSEARQALRISALEGLPPATILRRTNATLGLNERQPIITAIFGIVDVARSRFTYSCAGHPPPALATLSGEARYLEGGGVPLGVLADAIFPTHEIDLPAYSTLLLYTDGLIEFSRNLAREGHRLLNALDERVQDVLSDGAEALLRHMLDQRQVDDIAILVATLLPDRAVPLDVRLSATPQSAAIARRIASRFARTAALDEERTFNLALSVGELVANAVEHAYAAGEGGITLSLSERGGKILGRVTDEGTWREGPPMQDRGRGLMILRAVASNLRIHRSAGGTRVEFRL